MVSSGKNVNFDYFFYHFEVTSSFHFHYMIIIEVVEAETEIRVECLLYNRETASKIILRPSGVMTERSRLDSSVGTCLRQASQFLRRRRKNRTRLFD